MIGKEIFRRDFNQSHLEQGLPERNECCSQDIRFVAKENVLNNYCDWRSIFMTLKIAHLLTC